MATKYNRPLREKCKRPVYKPAGRFAESHAPHEYCIHCAMLPDADYQRLRERVLRAP